MAGSTPSPFGPPSSRYLATPSFRTEQADFFFPIRFLRMGRLAQREISLRSSIQRKPPNHSETTARHPRNSSRRPCSSSKRALRFQRLEPREGAREAGLHARQSVEEQTGGPPTRLAVKQFLVLRDTSAGTLSLNHEGDGGTAGCGRSAAMHCGYHLYRIRGGAGSSTSAIAAPTTTRENANDQSEE